MIGYNGFKDRIIERKREDKNLQEHTQTNDTLVISLNAAAYSIGHTITIIALFEH